MIKDAVIPYELPEINDHSFFFISQHISPALEAGLHRHEAWELYYVTKGDGIRLAGDTPMPFSEGDVVLIPPSMQHCWKYRPASANDKGEITYLMAAFSPAFVADCKRIFPEIRNKLSVHAEPSEALKFGPESALEIKRSLRRMAAIDEIGRLCEMLRLLPTVFDSDDHTTIGRPAKIDRDIRRMQAVSEYVMAHYVHPITLAGIAAHIGMNRSAFCTFFKRTKGMTFTHFLTQYRLRTAADLLHTTQKQISEICFAVGYNDLPHFTRVFTSFYGMSPSRYRKTLKSG